MPPPALGGAEERVEELRLNRCIPIYSGFYPVKSQMAEMKRSLQTKVFCESCGITASEEAVLQYHPEHPDSVYIYTNKRLFLPTHVSDFLVPNDRYLCFRLWEVISRSDRKTLALSIPATAPRIIERIQKLLGSRGNGPAYNRYTKTKACNRQG